MIYIVTGKSLISLITVVQVAVQAGFENHSKDFFETLQGFLTPSPSPVGEKLEKLTEEKEES